MTAGLVGEVLLRQVPRAMQAGIDSGAYAVFGSVVRSTETGRIVGHLVEAGGLPKLAALVGAGPLAPFKLAADGITLVQNEQIKAGIGQLTQSVAVLNQLAVGGMVLGAAGIGVSVVGFAMLGRKIDGVKASIDALGGKVDRVIEQIEADRQERIADSLANLRGLARSVDQRWQLSDGAATAGWLRDADEARKVHALFEARAQRMLATRPHAIEEATPLLDAASLSSALRISALALAGEVPAAVGEARDDAQRLEELTGRIGAADLMRAAMIAWAPDPGTSAEADALERAAFNGRAAAQRLRAREAAAATRAAPLVTVQAKGIAVRDWIAAARGEENAALLVMEA